LCVIKKSRKRRGYSPARGLQNTNPQRVVAPEKNYVIQFAAEISSLAYVTDKFLIRVFVGIPSYFTY